jgi:hypothetical protein
MTAMPYMEQCLLFPLQVQINHMKKCFAIMHLFLTTAWRRTGESHSLAIFHSENTFLVSYYKSNTTFFFLRFNHSHPHLLLD